MSTKLKSPSDIHNYLLVQKSQSISRTVLTIETRAFQDHLNEYVLIQKVNGAICILKAGKDYMSNEFS